MATAGPSPNDLAATPNDEESFGPTLARDPLIGAMLGEYRVLSRLGEGGMGVVYRGEQPVIGKPVAIKVLKVSAGTDHSHVEKLLAEARAISAARHPNIIDIFSFGQAPTGQQYFVMECLEGDPLDAWLAEHGRPTLAEAAKILQQILAGLTAAHAAGVIHRDLKPSNIFLAKMPDGERFVKLLDFGLAKRTAPNAGVRPTANVIVGTPLYMAPEQIKAEELGPWTDLYAVGCIAYELTTGAPLFAGADLAETLRKHRDVAPPPPRQLEPSIPESFEALVLELLAKAPDLRPKSAAIARRALERIDRQLSTARTRGSGIQISEDSRATQLELRPAIATPVRPAVRGGLRFLGFAGAVAIALAAAVALWPEAPPAAGALVELPPRPAERAIEPPVTLEAPPAPVAPVVSKRPPKSQRTSAEVDKRITRLHGRIDDELTGSAQRVARNQLDEIRQELKGGAPVDRMSKDLDAFEALRLARP